MGKKAGRYTNRFHRNLSDVRKFTMDSKFLFRHIFLSEHDKLFFLGSNHSHNNDGGRYIEFVDVWVCYQLISHVISLEPLSFHIFHKKEKNG